jgi:hypothetical protein
MQNLLGPQMGGARRDGGPHRQAHQGDYQALLKSLGVEHVVLDKSREGTGGGVRLATMHRVKGLEFPVMILAGVWPHFTPLVTACHVSLAVPFNNPREPVFLVRPGDTFEKTIKVLDIRKRMVMLTPLHPSIYQLVLNQGDAQLQRLATDSATEREGIAVSKLVCLATRVS